MIACSKCLRGYCERCIKLNEANACGKCEDGMVKTPDPETGGWKLRMCTCGAADARSMRARNSLREMVWENLFK